MEDITVAMEVRGILAHAPEVKEADLTNPAEAGCILITEVLVMLDG